MTSLGHIEIVYLTNPALDEPRTMLVGYCQARAFAVAVARLYAGLVRANPSVRLPMTIDRGEYDDAWRLPIAGIPLTAGTYARTLEADRAPHFDGFGDTQIRFTGDFAPHWSARFYTVVRASQPRSLTMVVNGHLGATIPEDDGAVVYLSGAVPRLEWELAVRSGFGDGAVLASLRPVWVDHGDEYEILVDRPALADTDLIATPAGALYDHRRVFCALLYTPLETPPTQ